MKVEIQSLSAAFFYAVFPQKNVANQNCRQPEFAAGNSKTTGDRFLADLKPNKEFLSTFFFQQFD